MPALQFSLLIGDMSSSSSSSSRRAYRHRHRHLHKQATFLLLSLVLSRTLFATDASSSSSSGAQLSHYDMYAAEPRAPGAEFYVRAQTVLHYRTRIWAEGHLEHEKCTPEKSPCSLGLFCVGPHRAKRCMRALALGARCGRVYDVCAHGLECRFNAAYANNARQNERLRRGRHRAAYKPSFAKICMLPRADGERCDVAHSFCTRGLACLPVPASNARYERNWKSVCEPARLQGHLCSVKARCANALFCVNGRCAGTAPLGHWCSKRAWEQHVTAACKPGLVCVNKKCMHARVLGTECQLSALRACEYGTYCHVKEVYRDVGVCRRFANLGEKCAGSNGRRCGLHLLCDVQELPLKVRSKKKNRAATGALAVTGTCIRKRRLRRNVL